jgi:transposase
LLRFEEYGKPRVKKNPRLTYKKIGRLLCLPKQTVCSICNRYLRNGCVLKEPALSRVGTKPRKVTDAVFAAITSREALTEWAHLPLPMRCQVIEDRHGVKLTPGSLSKYYKQAAISKTKAMYAYVAATPIDQLRIERYNFCSTLTTILADYSNEVIFFDETTFNGWQYPTKVWQPRDDAILVHLSPFRGQTVTVYGAISNRTPVFMHSLATSTNKEDTLAFFEQVHAAHSLKGKYIVLDNHPAHHSRLVTNYIDEVGAHLLFLPPSSSPLNSIERLWAWLKDRFKERSLQIRLRAAHGDTSIDVRDEIQAVIDQVTPEVCGSHFFAAFKTIEEVLLSSGHGRVRGLT